VLDSIITCDITDIRRKIMKNGTLARETVVAHCNRNKVG